MPRKVSLTPLDPEERNRRKRAERDSASVGGGLKIFLRILTFLHIDNLYLSCRKRYRRFRKQLQKNQYYKFKNAKTRYTTLGYQFRILVKGVLNVLRAVLLNFFKLVFPVVTPLAGLALLLFSVWIFRTYSVAVEVTVGNTLIGYVQSQDAFSDISARVENAISVKNQSNGDDGAFLLEAFPSYSFVFIPKDKLSADNDVFNTLYAKAEDYISQSYGFFFDGTLIGISKNENEFQWALSALIEPYLTGASGETYEILNYIEATRDTYPRTNEKNYSELIALFTTSPVPETHTVKKGETLESIAKKYGLSVPVLRLLNGLSRFDGIATGTELQVGKPYYELKVKTSRTVTSTETIPFQTNIIRTDSLYENETQVKQSGANGLYEVLSEVVEINGVETERTVISKIRIKDAVPRQVLEGTKTIAPSGKFIWPLAVSGRVSSKYGWRTLRGERNFHRGYDIAAGYGTKIFAADAGTVIATGYETGGLGYYVKIDHGNGITSIYGHASKIASGIKKGVKVYQGQTIAYVGSTGNSTGNHLHFALYNQETGEYMDPAPHLP